MAAGRTLRSLVSRRRRAEEEGEDEEGPVFMEDSQSEGSVVSEPDDEDEADVASVGGPDAAEAGASEPSNAKMEVGADTAGARKPKTSKKRQVKSSADTGDVAPVSTGPGFKASADTEAMMNGLSTVDREVEQGEAVDFEEDAHTSTTAAAPRHVNGGALSAVEKQRREHEEYRRKRDSNPAFIPNRGNFFMHDTRGQNSGPPPAMRGGWQARGRGRGGAHVGGPFSPQNQMALAERAAEQPWKHDLHDTINEEPNASTAATGPSVSRVPTTAQTDSARLFPRTVQQTGTAQPPTISFDSTTLLGTMQVQVFLPGMKDPKAVAAAPVRRYVRLPNHRPPLRRDKPVRVSLPDHPQHYIFPKVERSFIFIPRQMRANQQGYQRGYQRSIGGHGFTSRRTSMHGSMYSASVAPSRRSSLAGVSRDRAFSPAGSFVGMPPSRPIVRLPYGSGPHSAASTPVGPLSGYQTPTGMQVHTYPLPQPPQFQGTPTTTMHQPRPQKAISVTGIESPAMLQQPPPESQPFQNQLPTHMNEQPGFQHPQPPPQPYFSPHQQYQYPVPQPQTGTPLSGIPEQAIHAASFQPPGYGQPAYYPQYPPQQNFYYSPPGPNGYPQMPPMYMMQPPPQGYMLPPPGPPMNPPQPPAEQSRPISSSGEDQGPQSGMVAHESNGMVFYVPASEAQSSEQHYQPAEGFVPSYAMPGLPPPTPAPDSSMGYYYPQMPHGGMQDVGNGVYYPAQQ